VNWSRNSLLKGDCRFGLFDFLYGRSELVRLDNSGEQRSPRPVFDAHDPRLHEPDRDPSLAVKFSQFVEVLRNGPELVPMLFGDDNEAAGVTSDCVGEAAGQVVVISAAVLVLNDELRAVIDFGDDVDATTPSRWYFRLAEGRKSTPIASPSESSWAASRGVKSAASPLQASLRRPKLSFAIPMLSVYQKRQPPLLVARLAVTWIRSRASDYKVRAEGPLPSADG
jgi:hypothetical protein